MADFDTDVGLIPEHTFSTTTKYVTLISQGENGKERRRSKRSTQRRTWKLVFNGLTASDAGLIWTFYQSRRGAFEAFPWEDPVTTTTHTVRFKSDKLTSDYFTYNFLTKLNSNL